MASTEKNSPRRRARGRRPEITEEQIFYAGLGALRDEDPKKVETLIERGRASLEEGASRSIPLDRLLELTPMLATAFLSKAATLRRFFQARLSGGSKPEEAQESTSHRMPAMINAMMPTSVPTAPMVLQARRNSEARASLVDEFGLVTSAEIAELNQSKADNRAALASRWKGEGKIFSVKHDGRDWFPAFQFHPDGIPRETIAAILRALGGARGWETALWFTAPNGYLEGRRPVDLLEEDSAAVVGAAEHEAEEVYF